MSDGLRTDLALHFNAQADADLTVGVTGDVQLVTGRDNLAQALVLRLLVRKGDLARLGHRRYGSRIHELIGEPMDEANLQLLRRMVRQTLREDPRVAQVTRVSVTPGAVPGVLAVRAAVLARDMPEADPVVIEVGVDVG